MSFFDALIDLSFKTDADGNTVFYPYGFWVVQFGVILVGTIIDNILLLLAAPFLFLWYYRSIKRILKDTAIAGKK